MTWGIKVAEFLVEMELFPQNQSDGKQLVDSQLVDYIPKELWSHLFGHYDIDFRACVQIR